MVRFQAWEKFVGPIPRITVTIWGRPLPEGMSPCIVGFVVNRRRK